METENAEENLSVQQSFPISQQPSLQNQPILPQNKAPKSKSFIVLIIGVCLVLIIAGLVGGYYLLGNKQVLPQVPTQQKNISQDNPNSYENKPPLASITDLEKEDVFNKLTSNTWCNKKAENSKSMLAPTRKNYSFKKDGTYNYSHFSDYPEDGGSGKWNFRTVAKNGGIIFLETGDVLNFEINNNSLSLTDMSLDKCEPIKYDQPNYSVNNLPDVKLSPLYYTLTLSENKWKKSNEFDLFRLPTKVVFTEDGFYTAEFNNGECSYTGTWSLRKNQLIRKVPKDDCDFRAKGEESYHSYSVKYDEDILDFEGSGYVSESKSNPKEGIVITDFGSYGGTRVKIRYARPFTSGVINKLTIDIKNTDKDKVTLKDLSLSQTPYKRTSDAFNASGEEKVLISKDLSSMTLDPGQSYSFTQNVTFTGTGEFGVTLKLNLIGKTQPYNAREDYVLKL